MIAVEKDGIVLKANGRSGSGRNSRRGRSSGLPPSLPRARKGTAFIREAVEREIKRRESARPIKRGPQVSHHL